MKIHKIVSLIAIFVMMTSIFSCARFRSRSGAAPDGSQVAPGKTGSMEADLTVNGVTRHYRWYVPTGYKDDTPVALVLNFHGLGATSSEQEALSGMSPKAEKEGFIVAYPDGLNKAWRDGSGNESRDDLQFISALIESLETRYRDIDPNRIYATGISNGGGMTNRLACDLSSVIAAIGPVSGAYNLWQDCRPSRPVPVIAFHGTADQVVPFQGAGHGNLVPPIPGWAAAWAERNHCDPAPQETKPQPDVKVDTWVGCAGNASVVLYAIDNHGHSWPGSRFLPEITSQDVNATDVMWAFFTAHPMP